ncbi:MAG: heavy metal translocating P-type ATPase [Eubacteriales bacterium]|nr:heavy metal translocating P-type ATPase [Eubacteriales bacterium]
MKKWKPFWIFGISSILFISGLIMHLRFGNILPTILLCMASYLISGLPVLIGAVRKISRKEWFDEQFLMSIATVGAIVIGEYPEAAAVMLFYQLGELFQSYAVNKSRRSITELMDIVPEYANLVTTEGSRQIDPDEVDIGDIIEIKPGEKVPLDCTVIEGHGSIDTAALTGESMPVDVGPGSLILSGSINKSVRLIARVEKSFDDSTASKVLALIEESAMRKSRAENFITRFARIYTPIVVGLAVLLAIIPPIVLRTDFTPWVLRAFTFLVVSCPCAFVVSVPMSFFAGIGLASSHGILVKGSNYFEQLQKIDTVIFDKTGTLTQGHFSVTDCVTGQEGSLLEAAYLTESQSNHPLAKAVVRFAAERLREGGIFDEVLDKRHDINEATEVPGYGVRVAVGENVYLAGNARWMEQSSVDISGFGRSQSVAQAVVYIAKDGVCLGFLLLADQIKQGAVEAVRKLHSKVSHIVMLSGDKKEVATAVAEQLSITEVESELLPQDKVSRLEQYLAGKRGTVAFVGDGMNDAPALALADVGIAMGGVGSDAAVEAADVVLMTDEPKKIVEAIRISRRTIRIAMQNIVLALGIKVAVLALSALGLTGMWMAVFADVGVTVLAVLNALRILKDH